MRFVLRGFLCSLLVLPLSAAAAASGETLDTAPIDEFLESLIEEQDRQEDDVLFHTSDELFPALDGEEKDEEPEDGFLTIRIGSLSLVLQDVPLNQWYAPYVRAIAELHLVSGYRDAAGNPTGFFGPADPVTLEQVAKVATLAAAIDTDNCSSNPPAHLTASGAWSAAYVACAETKEWLAFGDPTVDVRRPATRQEVVASVLQAFNRPFEAALETIPFTDVSRTWAYAPAIAQAAADGIVSGYNDASGVPTGLFGPENNVTRAEFAKIVSIAVQLYAR